MTRKMGQIGGANVVWDSGDDGNAGKHCAVRLWLPGNSAVCYRLPVPQLICWCGRPPTASSVPE